LDDEKDSKQQEGYEEDLYEVPQPRTEELELGPELRH